MHGYGNLLPCLDHFTTKENFLFFIEKEDDFTDALWGIWAQLFVIVMSFYI